MNYLDIDTSQKRIEELLEQRKQIDNELAIIRNIVSEKHNKEFQDMIAQPKRNPLYQGS